MPVRRRRPWRLSSGVRLATVTVNGTQDPIRGPQGRSERFRSARVSRRLEMRDRRRVVFGPAEAGARRRLPPPALRLAAPAVGAGVGVGGPGGPGSGGVIVVGMGPGLRLLEGQQPPEPPGPRRRGARDSLTRKVVESSRCCVGVS